MNKLLIAFSLLWLGASAQKAEKIYPLNLQHHEQEYYNTQSKLWAEEVKKHPKDAEAWKNYYCATRYANNMYLRNQGADKEKMMQQIVAAMEKNVPNSVQYYNCETSLIGNSNADTANYVKIIKKGLAFDPNDPGLLESYINYCEINGHTEKLPDLYTRLYNSNQFAQGIIETGYNMLMSLDKNAIVFVCGDDDTYPMRMLQVVKKVRTDVTILNTSLAVYLPVYTKRLLKEKNVTLTEDILNKGQNEMEIIKGLVLAINKSNPDIPIFFDIFCDAEQTFPDSLYCTGLAWKYSITRFNNISRLKNNIENHFHLDYLDEASYQNNGISTGIVDEMKTAYVTPFAILYKHYLEMGESNDRTEFYKSFIMKYAEKLGVQKEMEEFLQGKRANI
jgi:hypothetical protein